MPLRTPLQDETQAEWMKYCMHELSQADTDRSQEQMVAICLRQWRDGQSEKREQFVELVGAAQARVEEEVQRDAKEMARMRRIIDGWMKQGVVDATGREHEPPGSSSGGQFVGGGASGPPTTGVHLSTTSDRAWSGKGNPGATRLGKQEAGALGERIAQEYVRGLGKEFGNAQPLNTSRTNFPVDMIGDHELYEVKTGQVSNSAAAQQWRATIGQPGKEESAWLKTASPEAKRAHNAAKQQAILDRKKAILREYSRKTGQKLNGKTITTIIDPDRSVVDVFVFKGFHNRIGYNSDAAKAGYVGSFRYMEKKMSFKSALEIDIEDDDVVNADKSPAPDPVWTEFLRWLDDYADSMREGLDEYFGLPNDKEERARGLLNQWRKQGGVVDEHGREHEPPGSSRKKLVLIV